MMTPPEIASPENKVPPDITASTPANTASSGFGWISRKWATDLDHHPDCGGTPETPAWNKRHHSPLIDPQGDRGRGPAPIERSAKVSTKSLFLFISQFPQIRKILTFRFFLLTLMGS